MFRPNSSLTFKEAKAVLAAGLQAIASGQTSIDLAELNAVDSSAVATLLAWQRAASTAGRPLTFTNLPHNLKSLAQLYGVEPLLNAQ
jgi:phospholipid transport system transporter-binding protein